jgi:hypothetical protein
MLYAAHADADYSDEEKEMIHAMFEIDLVRSVASIFNNTTEYQSLQIVLKHKNLFFPGAEGKRELLAILNESLKSDGEYNVLEKSTYQFIEKMIED